jgi:hypothetical protein
MMESIVADPLLISLMAVLQFMGMPWSAQETLWVDPNPDPNPPKFGEEGG